MQTSKYDLIERIVMTDDEELLMQVRNLLSEGQTDSWENLSPELRSALTLGMKQSAEGKVRPHDEVMRELRNRYGS